MIATTNKLWNSTSSHIFSFTFNNKGHRQSLLAFNKGKANTCVASASFASAETPNWNSKNGDNLVINKEKEVDDDDEEEEVVVIGDKKVKCGVEVISWRERRIKAEISVNADVRSVWNALTDYERLADFIPNLVSRIGTLDKIDV